MEILIGLIVYSVWEYALGKLRKPRANSTLEIVENVIKEIVLRKVKK